MSSKQWRASASLPSGSAAGPPSATTSTSTSGRSCCSSTSTFIVVSLLALRALGAGLCAALREALHDRWRPAPPYALVASFVVPLAVACRLARRLGDDHGARP